MSIKTYKRYISQSSLIELPSQGPRPPQQLLELVLLHLRQAPSPGADGVHGAVVARALDVSRAGVVVGGVDDGVGLIGGAGGVHFRGADERARVSLVGLAALGVRGLVDGQNSRVAVVVRLGGGSSGSVGVGSGLGLVEGHGGRRRVERAEALGEIFHGDLQVGHVEAAV